MENYLPVIVFNNSLEKPIKSAIGKTEAYQTLTRETLALEVRGLDESGASVIIPEGCICSTDADGNKLTKDKLVWNQVGIIDAKTFSILDCISTDGIYYIATTGLNLIRLDLQEVVLSTRLPNGTKSKGLTITGTEVF